MEDKRAWDRAAPAATAAIESAWDCGMPPSATALHARWWQLETWLRSLVFVEQAAHLGQRWSTILRPATLSRREKDKASTYMASPDAQDALAYLDVTPLFELLEEDWDRFAHALIDRPVWTGRAAELIRIRHRIGHCRRPHGDDLGRLEQTLRDLEGGAFRTVAAYNRSDNPDVDLDDPLVAAWGSGRRSDNGSLIAHAERQYDVRFRLAFSQRPWVDRYEPGQPVSGRPGFLWHAQFFLRGGRPIDLKALWDDTSLNLARERMVYLTTYHPFGVEVTFPAVDEAGMHVEAIDGLFQAVLGNLRYGPDDSPDAQERWVRRHQGLDPRVQVSTVWALLDDSTTPFSVFGA